MEEEFQELPEIGKYQNKEVLMLDIYVVILTWIVEKQPSAAGGKTAPVEP